MLKLHRLLERVKARRESSAPARLALRSTLSLWKTARRVPLVNRARVTLSAGAHRMQVRLFSYDDLLTVSPDYEPCLRRLPLEPGSVVVDAGAFIGRHTLEFARAVGRSGRVIAVEPVAANFALLERNVRLNRYANVTCVRCALGERDGEATLSYGRETSIASAAENGPYREQVAGRSLDSLLEELGITRVDVLKVDVEGAELAVLEGAEGVLAESPDVRLVIEVHGPREGAGSDRAPLQAWLSDHGFSIRTVNEAGREFFFALRPSARTKPTALRSPTMAQPSA